MILLGISAYFHDSAVAILKDGDLVFAAEEERFSRVKHDHSFPIQALKAGLKHCSIKIEEVDAVVFYEKPFLKFERILESYYHIAPRGIFSFVKSMPRWIKDKLMIKSNIIKSLKKIGDVKHLKETLFFSEHHLSHAASAFYPSKFEQAAILTIDGVGEWSTTSIAIGEGNRIEQLSEMKYPNSIGLLYSAFTQFLGFKVNSGEYKLMGLSAYGNPASKETKNFIWLIKNKLVDIHDDGGIVLNMDFFSFRSSLKTIQVEKWEKLFHIERGTESKEFQVSHANLALAIQKVTEEIVLRLAKHAQVISNCKNICLAGGVALNCVANGVLERSGLFDKVFVQPASGDSGGAIGAVLAYHFIANDVRRYSQVYKKWIHNSLLGTDITNSDIEDLLKEHKIQVAPLKDNELYDLTADLIMGQKIIGWCTGRMEFGPRALGNRSILADPRNPEMQQRINLKVKKRESFRPFAPAILQDEVQKYFSACKESPYMLSVYPINEEYRLPLPRNYQEFSVLKKLKVEKSQFSSITHADFSSRIQTVSKDSNSRFYSLINQFYKTSGCPMLINTSFNERGEPIVRNVKDAFDAFMRTDIDVLVLNNYVIEKSDVVHLDNEEFSKKFKTD